MRFRLREDWMLRDFSGLLRRSSLAYSGLNAFLYLSDNTDPQLWDDMSSRYDREIRSGHHITPYLIVSPTVHIISYRTVELDLARVHLSSPGIVEALGQLNVLKHMLDFFTNYRKENTERTRVSDEFEIKMRQEQRKDRQVELTATLKARELDIRERELQVRDREARLRTIGAAYDRSIEAAIEFARQNGKLAADAQSPPALGELVVRYTFERSANLLAAVALEQRVQNVVVETVEPPIANAPDPAPDLEPRKANRLKSPDANADKPQRKRRELPQRATEQQPRLL